MTRATCVYVPHAVPLSRVRTPDDARDLFTLVRDPRPVSRDHGYQTAVAGGAQSLNPRPAHSPEAVSWAAGWRQHYAEES